MKKKLSLLVVLALMTMIFAVPALGATDTFESSTSTQWSATGVEGTYADSFDRGFYGNPWDNTGLESTPWVWVNAAGDTQGEFYFKEVFSLPELAFNITGSIVGNCDNAFKLYINNILAIEDTGASLLQAGPDTYDYGTVNTNADVEGLVAGSNILTAQTVNYFDYANPAGLAYKLVVDFDLPSEFDLVDIKYGSCPNAVNLGDSGKLPVTIFGAAGFVLADLDADEINIGGVGIREKNNGFLMYSISDVNGDTIPDMTCHFDIPELIAAGALDEATTSLTILYGDEEIGSDDIWIVPASL